MPVLQVKFKIKLPATATTLIKLRIVFQIESISNNNQNDCLKRFKWFTKTFLLIHSFFQAKIFQWNFIKTLIYVISKEFTSTILKVVINLTRNLIMTNCLTFCHNWRTFSCLKFAPNFVLRVVFLYLSARNRFSCEILDYVFKF